jgi:hypothetical protein
VEQHCHTVLDGLTIPDLHLLIQGVFPPPSYWNWCKEYILEHIFKLASTKDLALLLHRTEFLRDDNVQLLLHDGSSNTTKCKQDDENGLCAI